MASVFITGSSQGLGLMAGRLLAEDGHTVVLHARNSERADDTREACPEAEAILTADVATLPGMRSLADQANDWGRFDAVIHNVGLGYREPERVETEDGLSKLWAVNVLTPYVLTAQMERPDRLVYLSSGMHTGGTPSLGDVQWTERRWNGSQAYADTKLHDTVLAFAVARRWSGVRSNAVSPGWVPTRMGGPNAPDDLDAAPRTQAWLAVSDDPSAAITGEYLYHREPASVHPAARDEGLQDELLSYGHEVSGVALSE